MGAEATWTGHVGVHCVGHFPLPAPAEKGAPGWFPRDFSASLLGRAWHLRVPVRDRDVSGFFFGGGVVVEALLELLGSMEAKRRWTRRRLPALAAREVG